MKVASEIITVLILLNISGYSSVNFQERILSFKSCEYDSDCIANSFCHRIGPEPGKCRCKEKFVLVYNKTSYECLEVATGVDSLCTESIQCEIGLGSLSECDKADKSSKKCKCIDAAHLGRDSKCHRTIALRDVCETNDNCLLSDGSFGFCYAGKCTCDTNYHISSDGKGCIQSSLLQQSCGSEESCVVTFSNCYGGICKCIPGYIETDDNQNCLKAASSVGENCTHTIQCNAYIKGSFCDNNKCTCKTDYHGYGNECVADAKWGEACNEDKQCIITADLEDSVRCTNETCTCVEGVSSEEAYGCIRKNSGYTHSYYYSTVYIVYLQIFVLLINF